MTDGEKKAAIDMRERIARIFDESSDLWDRMASSCKEYEHEISNRDREKAERCRQHAIMIRKVPLED